MCNKIFGRLLLYLFSFLIFSNLVFPCMILYQAIAHCDMIPDDYMPADYYDGLKLFTRTQTIIEKEGFPTHTDSSTDYQWIDGKQNISGANCWRIFISQLGFYQDYSEDVETSISYQALVDDEIRGYGSDAAMKDGTTSTTRYDPYYLLWKYGMHLGNQLSHSYTERVEYGPPSNPDFCEGDYAETIMPIGYETVISPFGTFPDCLRWERHIIGTWTCSGYIDPIDVETTFWSALNKGIVKLFVTEEGGKVTAYIDTEVVSGTTTTTTTTSTTTSTTSSSSTTTTPTTSTSTTTTILPTRPTVTTGSATPITSNSAILNGKVNPNGSSTEAHFEYGTSTNYGSATASADIGSGSSSVTVNATISDLISDTTYHYRLTAMNSAGTSSGADKIFYTAVVYVSSDGTCGGNTPCYFTIQEAIDAAESGTVIKILQGTYDEDLILSSSKDLTLSGGWDSTFTTQSLNTTVNSITISDGTIEVDKVILQ